MVVVVVLAVADGSAADGRVVVVGAVIVFFK